MMLEGGGAMVVVWGREEGGVGVLAGRGCCLWFWGMVGVPYVRLV